MVRQGLLMSSFLWHSSAADMSIRIVLSSNPAAFVTPSDSSRCSSSSIMTRGGLAVRRAFFTVSGSTSESTVDHSVTCFFLSRRTPAVIASATVLAAPAATSFVSFLGRGDDDRESEAPARSSSSRGPGSTASA